MWGISGGEKFQFPTNGKAYPKEKDGEFIVIREFKRFNSLRTGKPIQSYEPVEEHRHLVSSFQFPTNGKAYPKTYEEDAAEVTLIMVSIPYERESLSKVFCGNINIRAKCQGSFNSLRTGKPIQRRKNWLAFLALVVMFQFPTNGKAYPKRANGWFRRVGGWSLFQFPTNGKAYPKEALCL